MKCVYVGFSLSKQKSFFWKIFLNSIDFIQDALAEVLGEKVLITYFWTFSQCVPRGLARRRFQVRLQGKPFSPLFFFSFPFCLDFFLVIAILFGFFIQFKIFRFMNFLPYCLIFPFHRSPSRGPAIDVFLSVPVVFSRTWTSLAEVFKMQRVSNAFKDYT